MKTMPLFRLEPQDKVVIYTAKSSSMSQLETSFYVLYTNMQAGTVVVMNEYGHESTVNFDEIVDIEKARAPIFGVVPTEIWERFGGCPAYRGKPVRLLYAEMFERRVYQYALPLWPDGDVPEGALRAIALHPYEFVELGVRDEKHAITSMPARGWCNTRVGDVETKRRRRYRTAKHRVRQLLRSRRGKWLHGAVDESV